ncbi:PolC-type DNA polymerase III [bacterium]|nr:PolC-type DNA polymerase III [bacterium]
MQKELLNFLKHIKLDSKYYPPFETASIERAKYKNKSQIFKVVINLDYILDLRIYEAFLKAMQENWPEIKSLNFKLRHPADELMVNIYYSYFLDKYFDQVSFVSNLKKIKILLEEGQLVFNLNSEPLERSLLHLKPKLMEKFQQVGIDYPFKINVETISDHEIQNMISDQLGQIRSAGSERIIVEETKPNLNFVKKGYEKIKLADLNNDDTAVEFLARIFNIEKIRLRNDKVIYSFYVTDDTDSVMFKLKESSKFSLTFIESLEIGDYVDCKGGMIYDQYVRDWVFDPRSVEKVIIDDERRDEAEEKRVELHLHTNMSAMDGIPSAEAYIEQALKWGHKAIAITDHGNIQNFPAAQMAAKDKDIKVIYGMEGYVVDDSLTPAINPSVKELEHASYVVFDLETTGLSTHYDAIIEFGAVKVENGIVIDHLQLFVNPLRKLDPYIIEKTNIKDDMLVGAQTILQCLPRIMRFFGDSILVAHNANFDCGFLNQALQAAGLGTLTNPVIDTLDLARGLFPDLKRYSLGSVARYVNINYNEEIAHRADYDAGVLADVYEILLSKCLERGLKHHVDLNNLSQPDLYKSAHPYHMTFLVKNKKGLKNLFKMVSMSNIEYMSSSLPIIPKRRIAEFREGLLIGSACFNGEVFEIAQTRSYEELKKTMEFFDYIEIQPLANYSWLLDTKRILSEERLISILKDIVRAGKELGKLVVATGDCHYLHPRDKIYRDVYINALAVGLKRHPLYDYQQRVKENPDQHFRSTLEMIAAIDFLDDPKLQRELVITNTNLIADLIEEVEPVKDKLYTPSIPNVDAQAEIEKLCFARLHELYGPNPPKLVVERLNMELDKLRQYGYGVIYYLAYRLVQKSREDGYLVGSRGSVGSSLVASLTGISEVDPLPPHYLCPSCHHVEFFTDGSVKSGFDLEDKACPKCGTIMNSNGQNIPFETFLGITGDKVPDIDLNFATEYQAEAHNYTKVLLGENNVFRAGTISTVADKTAKGYVRNYFESINRNTFREAELSRLAKGCMDVKRTTGQHPAGIIVVPLGMDVHDFTPVQYPADEVDAEWKTTHFKFKNLHEEILKLDILGHVDPSALRMLQDLTGVNPEEVPMNDKRVLSLFTGISELGVTAFDIQNNLGTAGIPEFGTPFVKGVLEDAKPTKFSELVQISGLTHGTDVWLGNAQDLIRNRVCSLMDVVGCRDDIMTYLVQMGLERKMAFDIMEKVRKGRGLSQEMEVEMIKHGVPKWYIISCKKIAYMFPKAHAVAYVIMGLRIAWFKIYKPLDFYATYFSLRCNVFDIKAMIAGKEAIYDRLTKIKVMIKERSRDLTQKDQDLVEVLEVALEMTARGYSFDNLSLTKSQAKNFVVDHERGCLIPPMCVIDGLGQTAAESFVRAREEKPFLSKQDLLNRTQINNTQIRALEELHVLDELEEENQLSFKLF